MYSTICSKAFRVVCLFCLAYIPGAICMDVEDVAAIGLKQIKGITCNRFSNEEVSIKMKVVAAVSQNKRLTATDLQDFDLVVGIHFTQTENLSETETEILSVTQIWPLSTEASKTQASSTHPVDLLVRPEGSKVIDDDCYKSKYKMLPGHACTAKITNFITKLRDIIGKVFPGEKRLAFGIVPFAIKVEEEVHGYTLWLFKRK